MHLCPLLKEIFVVNKGIVKYSTSNYCGNIIIYSQNYFWDKNHVIGKSQDAQMLKWAKNYLTAVFP